MDTGLSSRHYGDPSALHSTNEPAAKRYDLPITFTGSGSEYFRIWIVNLLLTLVTLGGYYPWAKVRRLRYFYGNTVVGDHPLDFHGNPKRMLRGYILVGALLTLYSVAGKISPIAGFIALLILAALWPALFRASQQFRMANTSWRGMRFRFTGDLGGAYRAMLPLFIPGALFLLGALLFGPSETEAQTFKPPNSMLIGLGLTPIIMTLLLPLMWWLLKKYQHDHYALGQVQTELRAGPGSFYMILFKTLGIGLLIGLCAFGASLLVGGAGLAAVFHAGERAGKAGFAWAAVIGIMLLALGFYASLILVLRPYVVSQMQNLVWSRTKSTKVQFISELEFWPLVRLTLKNWLLMLLTVGLYWPFAAVAMARLRLEAVTLRTRTSSDEFASQVRAHADDAAGDAAGDMFGIDIGL